MIRAETINHTFVEHRLASREIALLTRLVAAIEKFQGGGGEGGGHDLLPLAQMLAKKDAEVQAELDKMNAAMSGPAPSA